MTTVLEGLLEDDVHGVLALMMALLEGALADICECGPSRTDDGERSDKLRKSREARAWLFSEGTGDGISAELVCDSLGVNLAALRDQIRRGDEAANAFRILKNMGYGGLKERKDSGISNGEPGTNLPSGQGGAVADSSNDTSKSEGPVENPLPDVRNRLATESGLERE